MFRGQYLEGGCLEQKEHCAGDLSKKMEPGDEEVRCHRAEDPELKAVMGVAQGRCPLLAHGTVRAEPGGYPGVAMGTSLHREA